MDNQTIGIVAQYHFLGQHLVALQGSYEYVNPDGKPTGSFGYFLHSGFVMSFREQWLLVTAGHILQNLEERL